MDWKDVKENLKRINNMNVKNYVCPNYVFNKHVFYFCLIVMLMAGVIVMFNHNWDFSPKLYYHCPESSPMCLNPYYNDPSVFNSVKVVCPVDDEFFCDTQYFFGGYSYGEKQSKDITFFPYFAVGLFVVGLVFNHFVYNKKGKVVI